MNDKHYENYNPRAAALAEARSLLAAAAQAAMDAGDLPAAELPAFIVEVPADAKNGDIASNIAMAGARTWHKAPKLIAEAILALKADPARAASMAKAGREAAGRYAPETYYRTLLAALQGWSR